MANKNYYLEIGDNSDTNKTVIVKFSSERSANRFVENYEYFGEFKRFNSEGLSNTDKFARDWAKNHNYKIINGANSISFFRRLMKELDQIV